MNDEEEVRSRTALNDTMDDSQNDNKGKSDLGEVLPGICIFVIGCVGLWYFFV